MPQMDTPHHLIDQLFRQALVAICDGEDQYRGTGFFITPTTLLTAAHVLFSEKGRSGWEPLQVVRIWSRTYDGNWLTPLLIERQPVVQFLLSDETYPLPDAALLTVDTSLGANEVCVPLAAYMQPMDLVFAYGHPQFGHRGYEPAPREYVRAQFEGMSEEYAEGLPLIKCGIGSVVEGFSGGPVLDSATGTAVGFTISTRDSRLETGFYAVPLLPVLERYWPELIERNRQAVEADPRWKIAIRAHLNERAIVLLDKLPKTGAELYGRDGELGVLQNSWAPPTPPVGHKVNVLAYVAAGGVGKSALINFWLNRLAARGYDGVRTVLAWSFYSQGTTERLVFADQFIETTLKLLGDPNPRAGSAWEKGARLADHIRAERCLLILDGLEPLQFPASDERGHGGEFKDQAIKALLRGLANDNPGLCVITTRAPLPDLEHLGDRVQVRPLGDLDVPAGTRLLTTYGATGSAHDLEAAVHDVKRNALALKLLGTFIRDRCEGDIRRWADHQVLMDGQQTVGPQAHRVMASYETWFGESAENDLLRIIGLFDRPAPMAALEELRKGRDLPGITGELNLLSEDDDLAGVLARLRQAGLLAPVDQDHPDLPTLIDAHPLVREFFGHRLHERYLPSWVEGNRRLSVYYANATNEYPTDLDTMSPLYAAVTHACLGGKYQHALDELYRDRILRHDQFYSTRVLGAFGAELAALSSFFTRPWVELAGTLPDADALFLMECVGVRLRGLSRLDEANEVMRAIVERYERLGNHLQTARNFARLNNVNVFLGQLHDALTFARKSLNHAELNLYEREEDVRPIDIEEVVIGYNALIDAKLQLGHEDLHRVVEKAWSVRRTLPDEQQLRIRLWYTLDVWTDAGDFDRVIDVATTAIGWATSRKDTGQFYQGQGGLLDFALDTLALGRARFCVAVLSDDADRIRDAAAVIDDAVALLRESGQEQELPRGLILRAEIFIALATDSSNDQVRAQVLEQAKELLNEARAVSERGKMALHLVDCDILEVRLCLALNRLSRVRWLLNERTEPPCVKQLLRETGYGRRRKLVDDFERALERATD